MKKIILAASFPGPVEIQDNLAASLESELKRLWWWWSWEVVVDPACDLRVLRGRCGGSFERDVRKVYDRISGTH